MSIQKLLLFAAIFLLAFSCTPELEKMDIEPAQEQDQNPVDIEVPDGFDFSYDRAVDLLILTVDTTGRIQGNSPVWLYSDLPSRGGKLLAKGISNSSGELRLNFQVPNEQRLVKAFTANRNLPLAQNIDVMEKRRLYTWCSATPRDPAREFQDLLENLLKERNEENATCESVLYHQQGKFLRKLNPVDGSFSTIGAASKAYHGIAYNSLDNKIYGIYQSFDAHHLWRIDKQTGIEQDLGEIPALLGSHNTYPMDVDDSGNLNIVRHIDGKWHQVAIDLDRFESDPVGSTQLNVLNDNLNAPQDMVYHPSFRRFYAMEKDGMLVAINMEKKSIKRLENLGNLAGKGDFGSIWTDETGQLIFHNNQNGKVFNTIMAGPEEVSSPHLLINGHSTGLSNAASCPHAATPFAITADKDQDGIPDLLDDAPEDAGVTVVNEIFLPSKNNYGTYAFEDRWPYMGDYDFNDLVADYNYTFELNEEGLVETVSCSFVVRASGASYRNGFGVAFDNIPAQLVTATTGNRKIPLGTSAEGVEQGQSSAVFILFDDIHEFLEAPAGTMINTLVGGTTRPAREVHISFKLHTALDFNVVNQINPFIFTNNERGNEIHLLNHPPTDLAILSRLGTEQDRSNPSEGQYYQNHNGFPWAIEFPGSFDYPKESVNILTAFPRFESWVYSSGTTDTDWYFRENYIPQLIY